jgi:uncharacterized protein (UPF0332 family)
MTPETSMFLAKANKFLAEADAMLNIGLSDAAGRAAYLAGFHAAQALISERTGRTVKTHKGVHTEFLRLTKGDQSFPPTSRAFLSNAYNLKAIADYETGPEAEVSAVEDDGRAGECEAFRRASDRFARVSFAWLPGIPATSRKPSNKVERLAEHLRRAL